AVEMIVEVRAANGGDAGERVVADRAVAVGDAGAAAADAVDRLHEAVDGDRHATERIHIADTGVAVADNRVIATHAFEFVEVALVTAIVDVAGRREPGRIEDVRGIRAAHRLDAADLVGANDRGRGRVAPGHGSGVEIDLDAERAGILV